MVFPCLGIRTRFGAPRRAPPAASRASGKSTSATAAAARGGSASATAAAARGGSESATAAAARGGSASATAAVARGGSASATAAAGGSRAPPPRPSWAGRARPTSATGTEGRAERRNCNGCRGGANTVTPCSVTVTPSSNLWCGPHQTRARSHFPLWDLEAWPAPPGPQGSRELPGARFRWRWPVRAHGRLGPAPYRAELTSTCPKEVLGHSRSAPRSPTGQRQQHRAIPGTLACPGAKAPVPVGPVEPGRHRRTLECPRNPARALAGAGQLAGHLRVQHSIPFWRCRSP
eukprot:gene2129-biopygen7931